MRVRQRVLPRHVSCLDVEYDFSKFVKLLQASRFVTMRTEISLYKPVISHWRVPFTVQEATYTDLSQRDKINIHDKLFIDPVKTSSKTPVISFGVTKRKYRFYYNLQISFRQQDREFWEPGQYQRPEHPCSLHTPATAKSVQLRWRTEVQTPTQELHRLLNIIPTRDDNYDLLELEQVWTIDAQFKLTNHAICEKSKTRSTDSKVATDRSLQKFNSHQVTVSKPIHLKPFMYEISLYFSETAKTLFSLLHRVKWLAMVHSALQ